MIDYERKSGEDGGILDTCRMRDLEFCEVCNAKMFLPGQQVQFLRSDRIIAKATIQSVDAKANVLTFEKGLPNEVQIGDLLAVSL